MDAFVSSLNGGAKGGRERDVQVRTGCGSQTDFDHVFGRSQFFERTMRFLYHYTAPEPKKEGHFLEKLGNTALLKPKN